MTGLQVRITGLWPTALLAALCLLGSCSARRGGRVAAPAGDADLTIAYLPLTHALPLVDLPRAQGLRVRLVRYGSWPELLDALNTGRVDGASVLVELAMKARSMGVGLSAYALAHRDGNVVVTDKTIRTAADLRGKSFAIPHRCSSHYILLCELLARHGLGLADVNVVELPPAEMPSALVTGQISGYCVAEPFGALAVSKGFARVLCRSEELWPQSICCALVFNDAATQGKAAHIRKFLHAYRAEGRRLEDKLLALRRARSLLAQQDEVLSRSMQWIDFTGLDITPEAYRVLATKLRAYHIIDNPPAYTEFVK